VTNDLYAPHFEKWAKELNAPFPVSVVNDGTRTNDARLGAIRDIGLAAESFNNDDDLMVLAGDNIFDSDLALFYQSFPDLGQPRSTHGYRQESQIARRSA